MTESPLNNEQKVWPVCVSIPIRNPVTNRLSMEYVTEYMFSAEEQAIAFSDWCLSESAKSEKRKSEAIERIRKGEF